MFTEAKKNIAGARDAKRNVTVVPLGNVPRTALIARTRVDAGDELPLIGP